MAHHTPLNSPNASDCAFFVAGSGSGCRAGPQGYPFAGPRMPPRRPSLPRHGVELERWSLPSPSARAPGGAAAGLVRQGYAQASAAAGARPSAALVEGPKDWGCVAAAGARLGVAGFKSRGTPRPKKRRVLSNPSLKRSANGVPPGPRGRFVYHRPRGPGVTPSSPA